VIYLNWRNMGDSGLPGRSLYTLPAKTALTLFTVQNQVEAYRRPDKDKPDE
jgi:hypothetical protein